MSSSSKLCLRWNGEQSAPFLSCSGSLSRQLLEEDVWLICGLDHGRVAMSRLVLSACSDLMAEALAGDQAKTVIHLPEASSDDLALIKTYMYTGQAMVEAGGMHNFLDLAHLLRVKGVGEQPMQNPKKSRPRLKAGKNDNHAGNESDSGLAKRIKLEIHDNEPFDKSYTDEGAVRSEKKSSGRRAAKRSEGQLDEIEDDLLNDKAQFDTGKEAASGDDSVLDDTGALYDDLGDSLNDDDGHDEALDWLASSVKSASKSKSKSKKQPKKNPKSVSKKEPRFDCLRRPRVVHERSDPLVDYDENTFIKRHRFDKKTFLKLVDIIRADLDIRRSRRGCPLTPVQQVAVALHHLGSQNFQRDIGQEAGTAQTSARNHTMQVMRALIANESRLLRLPGAEEMEQSCNFFQEHFGIPNVCMVVDSFLVKIKKRPSERELPKNFFPEEFLIKDTQVRYKQTYAHKCLFAVDHNLKIRFVDSTIPGLRRDSEVWSKCSLRNFLSTHNSYRVVSRRSMPLSSSVLVPYPHEEASVDPRKAELNSRLDSLLKSTSEKLISLMRRRFPFMKSGCRTFYENISRDLHASCILHNFAIETGCMGHEFFDEDDQTEEQLIVEVDDGYYEYQEEPPLSEEIRIGHAYRDALLVNNSQ